MGETGANSMFRSLFYASKGQIALIKVAACQGDILPNNFFGVGSDDRVHKLAG